EAGARFRSARRDGGAKIRVEAVLAELGDVAPVELEAWIARGWVRPENDAGGYAFLAVDLARLRLIRDLRRNMEVSEEVVPLVLSLLDQVYALRAQLRAVAAGRAQG
ncbi:MAG: hypothetical protein KGI51_04960, partial [Rhodospirillales bacterium]|nr:hypothetical protein [Rhodospirillales bacterium]